MSNYFESLSKICWNSGYFLYHAYAYYQHYLIYKKHANAATKDLRAKTDYLIMALLSIPQIQRVILFFHLYKFIYLIYYLYKI